MSRLSGTKRRTQTLAGFTAYGEGENALCSHAGASPGLTHPNSGSWCRNKMNRRFDYWRVPVRPMLVGSSELMSPHTDPIRPGTQGAYNTGYKQQQTQPGE